MDGIKEKNSNKFKTGDMVFWHTGSYGGEQGHWGRDIWWAETKKGKIVAFKKGHCLIEFEDGSRQWAKRIDISHEDN